jgi:trk system potassium uptake protein TrkH
LDFRPVLHVLGILLSILALSMVLPMLTDLYYGSLDWRAFFISILITAFFGGALMLSTSGQVLNINRREGFLLIVLCWVVISLFAALPLWLSHIGLDFTDAAFEAVSGITTTGSTVIVGLENTPPGVLLWRALLQWLGGIGIILMAMSILPFLKIGGMQMFQTELSESEKALPRATRFAASIGIIYVVLTILGIISYHMAGMSLFDSIIHSMTTLSTGGFSSYDSSFAGFEQPAVHYIAVIFMILGGLPFILYLKAINGNARPLLTDSQVRWFLSIVLVSTVTMIIYLMKDGQTDLATAMRLSAFNVVSIITGTGYSNGDYNAWGGFAIGLLFFLMVMGACAGSTTCGIKIFRFQILYAVTKVQIRQLMHPSGVFIPHYNRKPIPKGVPSSVMSFFFMYVLSFAILAILLSFVGLDFLTAMSGAATSISNVGPGLGEVIGPAGNFESLPDSAKWILCIGMILGRLELFPVLVMLSPQFWQR